MAKQKTQFDMEKISQVANDLITKNGTSVLKNKVIRVAAADAGLDEYTIWRTFLLKDYKTDKKGVYDISPLATFVTPEFAVAEDAVEEIVDDVIQSTSGRKVDSGWEDEEDEDDEELDFDRSKTLQNFDSEFFEDDPTYEVMEYIGDAYAEAQSADFMGDY